MTLTPSDLTAIIRQGVPASEGSGFLVETVEAGGVLCRLPFNPQQIRPGGTLSGPTMMTLADAVDLVLYAFTNGNNGDIFVQKAPAATIETLARAVTGLMGKPAHAVNIIGTRHGEKLYEALLSREERACAEDMGDYFRVPADGRDLNYGKFVDQGEAKLTQTTHGEDYNSHNTTRLDVDGMTQLLLKLEGMQRIARGELATVEEC